MPETPSRLSAVTRKPETAPPRSDTVTASLRLFCAAAAARTFERTEMYMPTSPATPEAIAPTMKEAPVRMPSSISLSRKPTRTPMITDVATAMMAMVRYWRLRKAFAPSKIMLAMRRISSVPVSRRSTSQASQSAKSTAAKPENGTIQINSMGNSY